jgi:hypothetical protein
VFHRSVQQRSMLGFGHRDSHRAGARVHRYTRDASYAQVWPLIPVAHVKLLEVRASNEHMPVGEYRLDQSKPAGISYVSSWTLV